MENTKTAITDKQWEEAVDNVKIMLGYAESEKSWTMAFYISGCKSLLKRYENGERTPDLYEEMINLH